MFNSLRSKISSSKLVDNDKELETLQSNLNALDLEGGRRTRTRSNLFSGDVSMYRELSGVTSVSSIKTEYNNYKNDVEKMLKERSSKIESLEKIIKELKGEVIELKRNEGKRIEYDVIEESEDISMKDSMETIRQRRIPKLENAKLEKNYNEKSENSHVVMSKIESRDDEE